MMPLVHFREEQGRHRRSSAISAALVVVALAVSGIPLSVLISPLVVVLPGLVTMVLLWALVRFTFRRTGIGGVLRRMETRPPRSGDLAKQRLANLVEEVAAAAAVPPPRVLLIDADGANVGAAGLTMSGAAVVVTRGFVDRLPRHAQQAVIAHVIASVGNGDLTVAAEIMTLIQTWGLVSLVLEAPFLPASRASLRLVGRTAMETLRGQADASNRELAVDTCSRAPVGTTWTPTSSRGCRTLTRWCSCSAICPS
jgi:Zn-dependent protease with chaperone function